MAHGIEDPPVKRPKYALSVSLDVLFVIQILIT